MNKLLTLLLGSLVFVVVVVGAYYFLGDSILKTYNDNLQKLNTTDLGNVLSEIKKEVLAPSPLNIGGNSNNVVLLKSKVIAETNIQRYDNGTLPPLIENSKLNQAALAKANDIFAKQYFEHVSPSGVGPGDLAKSFGYDYILEGENLILGNFKSEKEVVQLWMDSPGHRANILNNRFSEIGVAIIKGTYKGQTVWVGVQEFGLPMSFCGELSDSLKNQINLNQAQLDSLSLQINQKKSEIENTSRRSEKYNQLVNEYNQLVDQYNALVKETKNLILQYNNQVNTFNQCVAGK